MDAQNPYFSFLYFPHFFIFTLYFFWPPRHPLGASMHLAKIPVMFSLHKYTFLPNIFNYQLSVTLLQHIYENPNDIFFIKRNTKILKTMSISLVASSIMESSCIKIFNRITVDWQR